MGQAGSPPRRWPQCAHRPRTLRLRQLLAATASLAIFPLAVRAQTAPDAIALQSLADSLAPSSPPSVAAAFRTFATARAHGRRTAFDDALRAFDAAVRDAPADPTARWGRSLVKLSMAAHGYFAKPGAGAMMAGQSFYKSYIDDLVAAAVLETTRAAATAWLVHASALQGDRVQPVAVTDLLARVAAQPHPAPDALLALGRQRRIQGDDAAALELFEQFARAGGDRGVAAIEQARALAGLRRFADAAARYLDGAANESPATADAYRGDLGWIADSAELRSFDSIPAPERRRWLQEFFLVRDAESIRLPGERLRDHLRRWVFVHRHFRIQNPDRWSGFLRARTAPIGACSRTLPDAIDPITLALDPTRQDDARSSEALLDHRAIIYMRHGEPAFALGRGVAWRDTTSIAREAALGPADDGAGAAEALIWVYWIGDGPKVFSFEPALPGSQFGPRALSLAPVTYAPLLWLLGEVDPLYQRAARRVQSRSEGGSMIQRATPMLCNRTMQDLAILTETNAIVGVTSESHTLTFERSLDPVLQVAAVGDPSGGTGRALVVFAVPGDRLPLDHAWPGGAAYQLHLRITALDRLHGTVRVLDTVRTVVARDSLRAGEFLDGFQELPLPAGIYDVGVALMTNAERTGSWRRWKNVTVGSPTGTLGMSGIVLAQEIGGLMWPNRGDPLALNPLDAYPVGSNVPLYYEASGLIREDEYRTTIVVTPSGRSAGQSTRLAFVERAGAREQHYRRSIGLGKLTPGQHQLIVTIEHLASGTTVHAARTINLTSRATASKP